MESTKAQHAAQRALAAPAARRRDGHGPGDVVLVVVHEEAERAVNIVLNELREARLAVDEALRAADDVVAVGKQPGGVGGRVRRDVQDVPYVFCDGERGPLEGEAEGGVFGGNRNVDFADLLALFRRVSVLESGR
jgi:hypothetical protein